MFCEEGLFCFGTLSHTPSIQAVFSDYHTCLWTRTPSITLWAAPLTLLGGRSLTLRGPLKFNYVCRCCWGGDELHAWSAVPEESRRILYSWDCSRYRCWELNSCLVRAMLTPLSSLRLSSAVQWRNHLPSLVYVHCMDFSEGLCVRR